MPAKRLTAAAKFRQALPLLQKPVGLKHDKPNFSVVLSNTYVALGNVPVSEKMAAKARKYEMEMRSIEDAEMALILVRLNTDELRDGLTGFS